MRRGVSVEAVLASIAAISSCIWHRQPQEFRVWSTTYESLGQADQLGDLEPFVAYQLEAIHDALRSEIGLKIRSEMSSEKGSELAAEIGATPGAAIDAVILRDLATEPTLSARRLAERLQLSQRAVEKHLAALQQKGRLLRHGSPRAGYWQVL